MMDDELKGFESQIENLTEKITKCFEPENKLNLFFSQNSTQEGFKKIDSCYEDIKPLFNDLINNNINEINEVLKLDLKEEAITLKTKELLKQVINEAIRIVKERI
jgi:hypothetical protein